jgi:hypothetical protein
VNGWRDSLLSRRHLLAGSAAVAGAGVLAPLLPAEAAQLAAQGGDINVLLHDRGWVPDAAQTGRLLARDARIVVLGDDPVRQWRNESATWLAQPNARLLGITNWPDFLVLRGLAAESRRHVRFASAISDARVLTWLIA